MTHPLGIDRSSRPSASAYRRLGIGAPFAASIVQREPGRNSSPVARRIPETLKVPVTAALLLERPRRSLSHGDSLP